MRFEIHVRHELGVHQRVDGRQIADLTCMVSPDAVEHLRGYALDKCICSFLLGLR